VLTRRAKVRCNPSVRTASLTILAAALAGCGGGGGAGGPRADITSPIASEKIPGMVQAARRGDLTHADVLVCDLESDDPAVRLYAIQTLHRLTGETYGYRYYDEAGARSAAVGRWRAWLAERGASTRSAP